MGAGKAALLLVDVQRDYLAHADLAPAAGPLLDRVAYLLASWRLARLPVIHVHTLVRADGTDCMPHLRQEGKWPCVAGTTGAEAPAEAAPLAGEPIYSKTGFNGFANPALARHLAAQGVTTLVLAGVHLHACIRETALAAYQSGFRVLIAADAVASYDPLHAEVTRAYLGSRGMTFLASDGLVADLVGSAAAGAPLGEAASAWIGGEWQAEGSGQRWQQRNPADWEEILGVVGEARPEQIDRAAHLAHAAQGRWMGIEPERRGELLTAFLARLAARHDSLVGVLVREAGKPVRDARAEVARALELGHLAVHYFCRQAPWTRCADGVQARRTPIGVVAAITPFNHPLALAVGKLLPALALGNAVLWKPALAGVAVSRQVAAAAAEAGLPSGLLAVLCGDGQVAQRIARHAGVGAVTVTASSAAGRQLAMICALGLKPLQAELGGNNAVLVMQDADIESVVDDIAQSAFGFAGQRCTAGRRILVAQERLQEFTEALRAATLALPVGDPAAPDTVVGPLISRARQRAVAEAVADAVEEGACLVRGGASSVGEQGCWFAPTLVAGVDPGSRLFQEETFGPVAVLHGVADIEEAIALANAVPQGLVATLYSHDQGFQRRFLAGVQAGVLKVNQIPAGVEAEAPFGGWKASVGVSSAISTTR